MRQLRSFLGRPRRVYPRQWRWPHDLEVLRRALRRVARWHRGGFCLGSGLLVCSGRQQHQHHSLRSNGTQNWVRGRESSQDELAAATRRDSTCGSRTAAATRHDGRGRGRDIMRCSREAFCETGTLYDRIAWRRRGSRRAEENRGVPSRVEIENEICTKKGGGGVGGLVARLVPRRQPRKLANAGGAWRPKVESSPACGCM